MTELQKRSIIDVDTEMVISKRAIFDLLYDDGRGDEQVQLLLVLSGMHQSYALVHRKEFDQAIFEQQAIDDSTREELRARAVRIARKYEIGENFDEVVKYMIEGMIHVLDNHKQIQASIRDAVK